MSTLAERLAALKSGSSVTPIVNDKPIVDNPYDNPAIPIPNEVVEYVELQNDPPAITEINSVESVESVIDNDTTVNAVESAEDIIRRVTERAFGHPQNFESIETNAENLRKVMFANGFNDTYSVAKWELLTAAFNREMIKIHDMSITNIRYRIEGLQLLIDASKAMISACLETEKDKKKRETNLERETREQLENESYERDKAAGRTRRKGNVDKTGALVPAKSKLSEREKFIKKMTTKGMDAESAAKLWDED